MLIQCQLERCSVSNHLQCVIVKDKTDRYFAEVILMVTLPCVGAARGETDALRGYVVK